MTSEAIFIEIQLNSRSSPSMCLYINLFSQKISLFRLSRVLLEHILINNFFYHR